MQRCTPYLSSCMHHWYVHSHKAKSLSASSILVVLICRPSLVKLQSWVMPLQGQFESRACSYFCYGTYSTLDRQFQQEQEQEHKRQHNKYGWRGQEPRRRCGYRVIRGVTVIPIKSIVIVCITLLAIWRVDDSPLSLFTWVPPNCVSCAPSNCIGVQEADLLLVLPSRALNVVRL